MDMDIGSGGWAGVSSNNEESGVEDAERLSVPQLGVKEEDLVGHRVEFRCKVDL